MNKHLILPILAASLIVSGCANKPSDGHNPATTITVWHWMSDRENAFIELAKKYEAETGTHVKFDLYAPSESYSQKVKAAAQTNTLPDVFGVLGESRDLASYIKSGFVADLSDALAPDAKGSWRERLFDKAFEVNQFKAGNSYGVMPGVYGMPLDMSTIQFVYNKDLFAKAELDPEAPPRTWQEFMAASRALQDAGIPPLVSGFGEIWMLDALSSNWAMNIMGEDKFFDTYRGKVKYTDPDWVQVLSLFKEMADEGVIIPGAVTMVNKTAEQTFANGRAAMAFNGSWCVNVYKGMNPSLNYGAFLPPQVSATRSLKIWGGAGSSFMVNARSARKSQAIEFLKWLAEADQQSYLANVTNNLPANRNSLKDLSPILAQFADDIDSTTHPNVYPVHEDHRVLEAWSKGIQSILIGEKSPEQVAQEVQSAKEREMGRNK
ncbi:MAG: extracellular solute-binding protein [Candidatus Omnitrophica bacterium]|nr:extracellular solute-binding protein [Candidatus Omnitrophota bacterium]